MCVGQGLQLAHASLALRFNVEASTNASPLQSLCNHTVLVSFPYSPVLNVKAHMLWFRVELSRPYTLFSAWGSGSEALPTTGEQLRCRRLSVGIFLGSVRLLAQLG